jgi:hypothetical protein
MKFLLLTVLLVSCAHKEMNEKRASKMCRKIYGPEQTLPKSLPTPVSNFRSAVEEIILGCYRDYANHTKDPRDYVSCSMTTLAPNSKPRLTILSTQEMLLPEIVIQCANQKFSKLKNAPKVVKPIRLEKVFHHIIAIKG